MLIAVGGVTVCMDPLTMAHDANQSSYLPARVKTSVTLRFAFSHGNTTAFCLA